MKGQNNYAYIDNANLHKGIKELGWTLDFKRFLTYLKDKYGVGRAYIFIGYIPEHKRLYENFQRWGYTLVFKDIVQDARGKVKGNVDADLVVQAVRDCYEERYGKAILVTSDGDFAPLVKFLIEKGKLDRVIAPNRRYTSILLKRSAPRIVYLDAMKYKLGRRESI